MRRVEVHTMRNDEMLLPIGRVVKILGVHANTVRRWANEGLLPVYRLGPRGDRRFKKSDIDRFLEEGSKRV